MSSMQNLAFNPPHVKCRKCGDEIWSKYVGEFVTCKCGAISVDQTRHYTRYIGTPSDFEEVNHV